MYILACPCPFRAAFCCPFLQRYLLWGCPCTAAKGYAADPPPFYQIMGGEFKTPEEAHIYPPGGSPPGSLFSTYPVKSMFSIY